MDNSDQSLTSAEHDHRHLPKKRLGSLDLICLGWNCVIGSGIFLTQGDIAQAVGRLGPMLFLVGGLLSLPIGLCFGEMARRFPGTGGSALYAHRVFGPKSGFVVGWVMWMSGIIGGATVSRALADYYYKLRGWDGASSPKLAAAIVVTLGIINLLGTRGGSWTNNLLAGLKLGPILLACLMAPWWVGPGQLVWPALPGPADLGQLKLGLLLVLYTYSGFEEIALPAGEARDSERTVPRAIVIVLISSALAYTALQGLVSVDAATASSVDPLHKAISPHWPWLGGAIIVAALASFAGVNASIAFTTPRSLWTLAHHGWFPRLLARLDVRTGSPRPAVFVSVVLTVTLALLQDLEALVSLSVLASLLQHLATVLACWKLRGWSSRPGLPHLSVLVCLLLLLTSKPSYIIGMGEAVLFGLLLTTLLPDKSEQMHGGRSIP